jgi:predicted transcriptional regulator
MAADIPPTVLELAAQIVSAHVANNAVAKAQISELISGVHHALATAEQLVAQPPKPEPAIPVKKSMRADHIVCLDCGKRFSMLKRHLMADRKLTVQQYRQRWGLPSGYPVICACKADRVRTDAGSTDKGRTKSRWSQGISE